jgi:hypothetical protein
VRGQHVRTAATLLVLLGILAAGALVGVKFLLSPTSDAATGPSQQCVTTSVKKGQRVAAGQVQVSVFNAGTRSGLADQTLSALTRRGFKKGEAGNAPSTSRVKVAQVWTTRRPDPAARLVARQFGPATTVRIVKVNLGPGVDVVVGDGFQRLGKAKRVVVATTTSKACLRPRG